MAKLERCPENSIEWITGDEDVGITLSQTRWINRMTRLAASHPGDVKVYKNEDGSIFATAPLSWVKLSPPRKLTDEHRAALSERMQSINAIGSKRQ